MRAPFVALIIGVLVVVIGLTMGSTIVSTAAAPPAGIGSFSGASSMNDLVPTVYYAAIVVSSVGLIGVGLAGAAGLGPLRKRGR